MPPIDQIASNPSLLVNPTVILGMVFFFIYAAGQVVIKKTDVQIRAEAVDTEQRAVAVQREQQQIDLVAALRRDFDQLKAEHTGMKARLDEVLTERNVMRGELSSAHAKIGHLEDENRRLQAENDALRRKASELQDEVAALRARVAELEARERAKP